MTTREPVRKFHSRRASCAVFFVAIITGCSPKASDTTKSVPTVSAAMVVVKDVHQWNDFNGRIEAVQNVSLRPRVSGYIERVAFKEGQEVRKGDVLFTIDARNYRAGLERALAELARARAQAELAQSESTRALRLNQQQATSTETLEQRRAAATQAHADVQAAQAAVTQAKLNLEWTQVRAPIDGRAGRALFTAGNFVAAGDSASVLTTLVSQDKVYVYFDVDESVFRRYSQTNHSEAAPKQPNVNVGLVGETGYPHAGNVDFFDNQLARSTGTISVRATLDNTNRLFTPGLFARVRLREGDAFEAVLISEKAVLTDQDRKYVYIVDAAGVAQRRDIQLGGIAEGMRMVRRGLKAGDTVVVEGVHKITTAGTRVDAKQVTMLGALPPSALATLN